jgi:hypothetical protein
MSLLLLTLMPLFSAFQDTTELQPYTVLERRGELEIRHYPEAILATFRSGGVTYDEAANSSFRRLARYIFGGNRTGEQIAMTAPVHMTMGEEGSEMAFVMPSAYPMERLPDPRDPEIRLSRSEARTVAAITFGGWASDRRLREKAALLMALLEKEGLTPAGPWSYLGYDPPWRLWGRRNDVIIPIRRDEAQGPEGGPN